MKPRVLPLLRVFPALVWVIIQFWMGLGAASAGHASSDRTGHLQVSVVLCGASAPITIDLGGTVPDPAPAAAGHECEWCKAFGVTTLPSPGAVPHRIELFDDLQAQPRASVGCHGQLGVSSYLSRAPPV